MTSDGNLGINLIRAYANGGITVNDIQVDSSVSVSPDSLVRLPELRSISDLADTHADTVLATDPEVVLLGTGQHQVFAPATWLARFRVRPVGVEVMTTAAACRTYNVLAAEQRRVTALLIL